nr:hypothetical transcript [Hymenolepis microstoma]
MPLPTLPPSCEFQVHILRQELKRKKRICYYPCALEHSRVCGLRLPSLYHHWPTAIALRDTTSASVAVIQLLSSHTSSFFLSS